MGLQANLHNAIRNGDGMNERSAHAALAELRGEIQTCLERRRFFGKVTCEIEFVDGNIEFWTTNVTKKTKANPTAR